MGAAAKTRRRVSVEDSGTYTFLVVVLVLVVVAVEAVKVAGVDCFGLGSSRGDLSGRKHIQIGLILLNLMAMNAV